MTRIAMKTNCVLALAVAGILAAGPALAEKPSWAGGGKGAKSEHFSDQHRTIAHDYYSEQSRNGRCPPGLAKKDNGCMPPGQAKKWSVGQPLPSGVSYYYDVPPTLVSRFGQPPAGYRYARVDNDIVLISPRNRTVIDVIVNPGRF